MSVAVITISLMSVTVNITMVRARLRAAGDVRARYGPAVSGELALAANLLLTGDDL
jgi:hypothetical protein